VSEFKDHLTISYYRCIPPGQIRQRNLGISNLRNQEDLVGFLDDDLVLEPDAIEAMIDCWNRVEPDTAGIGFNIINAGRHQYSHLMGIMLADSRKHGAVIISGSNSGIHGLTFDTRSQWLGGGYTIWRKEILEIYPNEYMPTKWAIGEDLNYSYPIGQKYPLYVCAGAKVRHEHVYDQAPPDSVHRYRGRQVTLARTRFVLKNRNLSKVACLWMLASLAMATLVLNIYRQDRSGIKNALGQIEGVIYSVMAVIWQVDIDRLMMDP